MGAKAVLPIDAENAALCGPQLVRQLEADIRTFIDLHNRNPKPFKWTKSADQILASDFMFDFERAAWAKMTG
jgi:hypothetical protein